MTSLQTPAFTEKYRQLREDLCDRTKPVSKLLLLQDEQNRHGVGMPLISDGGGCQILPSL